MRSAVAFTMMLLLVHLQVAGAACLCTDGHAGAHSHDGDGDGDEDDAVRSSSHEAEPAHDSDDSDHHGGPSHCECAPAQPYAAPEAAPIVPRAFSWTGLWLPSPGVCAGRYESAGVFSRPARPPPVQGVSSASPSSLPVMLI